MPDRRVKPWPLRIAVVVAVVLLGGGLCAWLYLRRQLPDESTPALPGLVAEAQVRFDKRAVPTIRAAGLRDALRVQGYLVARERMFQLELQRRAADGRLSELFGAELLQIDRLHRLYGFRQVAEAAVPLLPAAEREALEAYADGVNAFLSSHRGRLGLELSALSLEPSAWTPADSLKILLLMYESLTETWRSELQAEALQALPEARRRFLQPRATAEDVLLVPDLPGAQPDAQALLKAARTDLDRGKAAPGAGGLRAALASSARSGNAPSNAPGLPEEAGEREASLGSNNWVVSGRLTASGKPLLANDPHLALRAPGAWYALRIELPGRWVQGVCLPGAPGIVLGQNDRLAWGFTNLGTDVQDLFKEPAIGEREERIAIRGGAAEALKVPLGKHGPQIRPGYSLHWTALDPSLLRFPLDEVMLATDWDSFNKAFDGFYGPGQNVVYADAEGHIGWRATGLIPLRGGGHDGSLPVDGTDPANDWQGFVPQAQMPRVLDPASGYLATANQRLIGSSFPTPVAARWESPARARRIVELLAKSVAAGKKLDREDMERIQLDIVSLPQRELVQLVSPYLDEPARQRFAGWDGAASAGDARPLEAMAWMAELERALRVQVGGEAAAHLSWPVGASSLLAYLRADGAALAAAGLPDKAALVADAAPRVRGWLAAQREKTWGDYDALRIQHPLGAGGRLLSWLFDPPVVAQNGSGSSVRVAEPKHGQSFRHVVDFGAPQASTLVLPLGQSGHLGSPHRLDQMPLWLRGDPGGGETRLWQPGAGALLVFGGK